MSGKRLIGVLLICAISLFIWLVILPSSFPTIIGFIIWRILIPGAIVGVSIVSFIAWITGEKRYDRNEAVSLLRRLAESAERSVHHLTDIQLSVERKQLKGIIDEANEFLKKWED